MKAFRKWVSSDNVIKTVDGYRTQCTQYKKLFSFSELEIYFKKEYLN